MYRYLIIQKIMNQTSAQYTCTHLFSNKMNQHFHFAVLLMYQYMYMEQLFFIILLIELALTFEKYNLQ